MFLYGINVRKVFLLKFVLKYGIKVFNLLYFCVVLYEKKFWNFSVLKLYNNFLLEFFLIVSSILLWIVNCIILVIIKFLVVLFLMFCK